MLDLRIGRGILKDQPQFSLTIESEFAADHANLTLEQIAQLIARQLKMADGAVRLTTFRFEVVAGSKEEIKI